MTTIALIQARMSSNRFPGKVLADLAGRPLIAFMVERARRATTLSDVAVITSTDPSDHPIAVAARTHGFKLFRGDLHDVLQRYDAAARHFMATKVVRLTGDCPLVDPVIIDAVVRAQTEGHVDYSSNTDPPTFADGMDVECFTREALARACAEARQPAEREHVTLWMRSDASPLRRANVTALLDGSRIRLTVDYPDDLEMLRRLVSRIGRHWLEIDYYDLLRCLDAGRDLMSVNRHARNEGLAISLSPPAK